MKYVAFAVCFTLCVSIKAEELFRPVLSEDVYKDRMVEVLRAFDNRQLKTPPEPANDFFVAIVQDEKQAEPVKLWDRIVLVNGKRPENVSSITRGSGKYSILSTDGKERVLELKKWPPGVSVIEKYELQQRCIAQAPRNERWNKHLFVAVHAATFDNDLAETAFHHALKAGMADNICVHFFGALIQFHRRAYKRAAELSQKVVNHEDEVIASQAAQLHYWAVTLAGSDPQPPEDKRFLPSISAFEVRASYGSFMSGSQSANKASLDMRREDLLPKLQTNSSKPFAKKLQEHLSKYKRYEHLKPFGQGFYVARMTPYNDAYEFSALVRYKPATPGPIWFRRSFVIGFVPNIDRSNNRESVPRIGDYFGISFGENDLIFGHAYPNLNGGMLNEALIKDMQNGNPHFVRMILAKGFFEISIDGKPVYCAPVGKEFNSFAFVLQAEGMEYAIDQVGLYSLSVESAEKTQLALKEYEKKAAKSETPLHAACRDGSIAACRAAVSAKMDLNALDTIGRTPAEVACDHLNHQCALFLLQNGAQKTIQLAAMYGTISEVEALCVKQPDSAKTIKANGPLHLAVFRRNIEIVKKLVECGADVNAATSPMYAGNTPLHFAGMMNHFDMAKYLIEKGARLDARNAMGKTPAEFTVLMEGTKEMIELLSKGRSDARPKIPPRPPEDF